MGKSELRTQARKEKHTCRRWQPRQFIHTVRCSGACAAVLFFPVFLFFFSYPALGLTTTTFSANVHVVGRVPERGKKKTLYSPAGGNGAPTTRRFYIHYRVAYIIWSYRVQPLRLRMYSILYMQLCVPTTNNFSNLNKLSNGQCINRGPWYRPVMQISSRLRLQRGNVANGRVSSVKIRSWVITRVVFLVCVKIKWF